MKRLEKPLPYEVWFVVAGQRKVIRTHSRSQAETWRRMLERDGKDPTMYLGEMEIA